MKNETKLNEQKNMVQSIFGQVIYKCVCASARGVRRVRPLIPVIRSAQNAINQYRAYRLILTSLNVYKNIYCVCVATWHGQ